MRRVLAVAVLVFGLAAVAPAPTPAAVAPYGTDDAGGFRNILPPGEAGTDNAIQLAAFRANNQRPAHWMDQQPLYENLLYASPALTHDQVAAYYKDATFGVRPEDVETTESPRPGLTIIRDKQYGVPHVYGDSRADVMFGAGYAGAEDRLFLMDVLRHTGRAELSSFAGGAKGNREMDRVQWALAPYTEADLQRQIDQAPVLGGAEGAQLVQDVTNYVAGINAYIAKARLDPTKMPGEYAAFGKQPEDWKVTDVIAEASLIGGIFGKGGGAEVRSALALEAFEKQFGQAAGRAAWENFREHNDPEAPVTVAKRFPYETTSPFSKTGRRPSMSTRALAPAPASAPPSNPAAPARRSRSRSFSPTSQSPAARLPLGKRVWPWRSGGRAARRPFRHAPARRRRAPRLRWRRRAAAAKPSRPRSALPRQA